MTTNSRITTDPAMMGGAPCIRGLRVTTSAVAGLMAAGRTDAEILAGYPYLEAADLDAVRAWLAAIPEPGTALADVRPDPAADDLAALAELLAWRRAGEGRGVEVRADGGGAAVSLWHRGGAKELRRGGPTVGGAVRAALAAWGG